MSQEYGTTRWWENYLVRYLMPSIAGVAIVNWLCSYAGNGLRLLLFLPVAGERLDATSLNLVVPLWQSFLLYRIVSRAGVPCDTGNRFF